MTGRRLALLGLAVLVVAGCGSSSRASSPPVRTGPPGVVRIALTDLAWPLDPALAETRDEIALGRALLATPLRVGEDGALRPGLCSTWASEGFRTWRFRCTRAAAIAAELRRVAALRGAPSAWLFANAAIEAQGGELRIVLRRPWRRFPYALTAIAAAPPGVPGPFAVRSASPGRIVAVRPGLRLVFTRMEPHAAAVLFRRGGLDEAPVALGDIRAARLDPALDGLVRVRGLLGVDLVAFQLRNGPVASLPHTREAYWQTADRQTYDLLVPETAAPPATGLLSTASKRGGASAARGARAGVGSLPPVAVPIAVRDRPELVYGAELAAAQWRDVGLGASVRPLPARALREGLADVTLGAWFGRVLAPYPRSEALLGQVLLPRDARDPWPAADSTAARILRDALAAADDGPLLARADALLQDAAAVVPLARVADVRLVSPRLQGWREDALGSVDYTRVRARASSRSR